MGDVRLVIRHRPHMRTPVVEFESASAGVVKTLYAVYRNNKSTPEYRVAFKSAGICVGSRYYTRDYFADYDEAVAVLEAWLLCIAMQ